VIKDCTILHKGMGSRFTPAQWRNQRQVFVRVSVASVKSR